MPREKSCGAVVFRKNRELEYLLLLYKRGRWGFVKGQVEPHETEKDTVMRELKEETSITKAQLIAGFRKEINYFYKRGGKPIYKEVAYFLIKDQNSKVEISYEHVGYEWLSYHEAMKRLAFQNAKNVLRKAHEFLKKRGIVEES